MSSFLTPEQMYKRKKQKKRLLYAGLFLFTIILIAGTTLLTYQM
ncbi:hypothetical protein QTG56_06820 [Rossellomorea sp. AcN35-11]|nr:hypothetical protein QTG56_06820 [Rossellomorea sp. AcN35-11]